MRIYQLTEYLESLAPLSLQESYDNCGLLVGHKNDPIKKALLTLDCTEAVVEEAIREKCQLIIAHHPIIFSGLKKLNGNTYIERVVMKAIKHDIALYAIHTNYDHIAEGVNAAIAERLGLCDRRILQPMKNNLKKLQTYIPAKNVKEVTAAVFAAGAGKIGDYSETGFSSTGIGTFCGNEKTNPHIGKAGVQEHVEEIKWETIFPAHTENAVVSALLKAHPYEEVAYDIFPTENKWNTAGAGIVGRLKKPMGEMDFLKSLKTKMNTACVRHTALRGKRVETVAVCGGAGSFLLQDAIAAGADVFVTADFKYHQFFDAEGKLIIADIGHYESEQFTPRLLYQQLVEKFPRFALHLSTVDTNPINYL